MNRGVAIRGGGGVVGARPPAVSARKNRSRLRIRRGHRRATALAGADAEVAASAAGAIEHPDVDLVIVATPHHALAGIALEALLLVATSLSRNRAP